MNSKLYRVKYLRHDGTEFQERQWMTKVELVDFIIDNDATITLPLMLDFFKSVDLKGKQYIKIETGRIKISKK